MSSLLVVGQPGDTWHTPQNLGLLKELAGKL